MKASPDPFTGREIRSRKTCKTGRAAQIEFGKLIDQYLSKAGWDVSTRESNLGYIRRACAGPTALK